MSPEPIPQVQIRRATAQDAAVCAPICYEAFVAINQQHNFPSDFEGPEVPHGILGMMFSHPPFYCFVAEVDGHVVGSNCLDERSIISGLGPITVDPSAQNTGVGRKLMEAALERSRAQGKAGVRLVQAAFHNRSLSLYASLGFDIREPLACMKGPAIGGNGEGCLVRLAEMADLPACDALSFRVHGLARGGELSESIDMGTARVVVRDGRITAYASAVAFWGHATAESNRDLEALLASAESIGGSGVLIPTRNTELFRWCLANGLRVVQPMTLMSYGLYQEPSGAFWPSILF
jgi:ribosomal protein S18 acetylase RimI-like enzyme